MKTTYTALILMLFFCIHLTAQIDTVIVETYYISDDKDSTNVTGGKLPSGSTTYRIYIDLKPGNKLLKIYGSANHPLKFCSTAPFFNHKTQGKTFGYEIAKSRYRNNTVALDTWLTIGETVVADDQNYFGILKTKDRDGSFIGGVNNNGGSALIAGGLLTNTNTLMGIPLTTSDGMDTMSTASPGNLVGNILDVNTNKDSTMFGSLKTMMEFVSYDAFLSSLGGVKGVIANENQVIVAQLTTKGNLSFELNVEVEVAGKTIKYVAKDSAMQSDETFSRFLKYPLPKKICYCKDPNYWEYVKKDVDCVDNTLCKTKIVFGCSDTAACNYSEGVFNVPSLCCYPGNCGGRDINVVCPSVTVNEGPSSFNINPNPTQGNLFLNVTSGQVKEIMYAIYDAFGTKVIGENLGINKQIFNKEIDLFTFNNGLYFIRVTIGDYTDSKVFMKN